jgi:hypothetical protein
MSTRAEGVTSSKEEMYPSSRDLFRFSVSHLSGSPCANWNRSAPWSTGTSEQHQ